MTAIHPTGRREDRDNQPHVVFERTFRAPIEDVWAAVTEPDRLQHWIGTWSGDLESGQVEFRMTAEGEDAPAEPFTIHACEAPRLLDLSTEMPAEEGRPVTFHLVLRLGHSDGVTTLEFAQSVPIAGMAESMGPGWDYYLDRLVVAQTGGQVDAISFDDYYPADAEHYRAVFGSDD